MAVELDKLRSVAREIQHFEQRARECRAENENEAADAYDRVVANYRKRHATLHALLPDSLKDRYTIEALTK